MTLKIDANFEEKLTCVFKNDLMLKNGDFVLESKMSELNQNGNSKQLDCPDAV